jgi:hypothetical protein
MYGFSLKNPRQCAGSMNNKEKDVTSASVVLVVASVAQDNLLVAVVDVAPVAVAPTI